MNYRTFIHFLGAIALAMASSITAASSDSEFTVEDFSLNSAQELVDVCLAEDDHPHYREAVSFCYGFFEGAVRYDEVISKLEWHVDLVCPPPAVTRQQAVAVFLDYMGKNPQYGSDQPIDAIFRSLVDKWPCPEKG